MVIGKSHFNTLYTRAKSFAEWAGPISSQFFVIMDDQASRQWHLLLVCNCEFVAKIQLLIVKPIKKYNSSDYGQLFLLLQYIQTKLTQTELTFQHPYCGVVCCTRYLVWFWLCHMGMYLIRVILHSG